MQFQLYCFPLSHHDGKEGNSIIGTAPTAVLPTVTEATDTSFTSEPTVGSGLPIGDGREASNEIEAQLENHNLAMEVESQGELSGGIAATTGSSVEVRTCLGV